jgi:hypothetical protein
MVSGSDLVVLFLGLTITTLSFYFLSGISPRNESPEAAPLQSVACKSILSWLRGPALAHSPPRKSILVWLLGPAFAASGFALLYQLTTATNIGRISIVLGQRTACPKPSSITCSL